MRILYVIHQFYPEFGGGTEHVTLNLARMAQRGGHHVEVFACTNAPESLGGTASPYPVPGSMRVVHQGVPITFVPRTALPPTAEIGFEPEPGLVEALVSWLQAEKFDFAHVMHTMRMGSTMLALQRAGVPYMMTLTDFFPPCARINLITLGGELCHGPEGGAKCSRDCLTAPWTPEAYHARYQQARALLAAAAERCVPSDFVAQRYRDAFPDLGFRVLPHGIDLLKLAAAAVPRTSRGEGPLQLVYVGSIIEQKGLDVLLRALALVPKAEVKLTVMGGFWGNSGYHAEVQALAEADPRVTFAGKLTHLEVFARMAQADLLCLPSRVPESFSLVMHEAAGLGVPALVSDIGAPPQFVLGNECGDAVKAGDAAAWAAAISRVVQQPEVIDGWRDKLPLPLRVEEEAFYYESLYRRLLK